MSARVEAWVWGLDLGNPTRKLILLNLAASSNDGGWSDAWTQDALAHQCQTTRQTANGHIRALRGMGVLQESTYTTDGGRGGTRYRIIGPWVSEEVKNPTRRKKNTTRVGKADPAAPLPPSSPPDPLSYPPTPHHPENQAADAADPDQPAAEYLGQRRWRVVSSRPGKGPYVVDLARSTCNCEAPHGSDCKHIRIAKEAEDQADSLRRSAKRNAIWDALTETFGATTERTEAARGVIVTDLAEMLVHEKVPSAEWGAEITRRYHALVGDWGVGKVTLHAFVNNWTVAGKLAGTLSKDPTSGNNGGDDDEFSRGTIRLGQ